MAAAFGRLCVETAAQKGEGTDSLAAAFGRLCVETYHLIICAPACLQPPSGGCVLKLMAQIPQNISHFAAAFGRLCVETIFAPIKKPH